MRKIYSTYEARQIGHQIGIDFCRFDIEQFRIGLSVEFEINRYDLQLHTMADDALTIAMLVGSHLLEMPNYYTHLIESVVSNRPMLSGA